MTDDKHLDPSELTTQMVWREIGALKELMITRLDAMQKAIDVAHSDLTRVPTDVQKQVGNLKELHEEKIKCLRDMMEEKFVSVERMVSDREAVSSEKFASIQTQLGKSDTATSTQIDGLNDKISDVKDRVIQIEGTGTGAATSVSLRHASGGYVVAIIGSVVGVIGLVSGILFALRT